MRVTLSKNQTEMLLAKALKDVNKDIQNVSVVLPNSSRKSADANEYYTTIELDGVSAVSILSMVSETPVTANTELPKAVIDSPTVESSLQTDMFD